MNDEPVTDEILEQHIENSDGRWVDGEFRIDGPDLMSLLRAVSKPAEPARKPMTEDAEDEALAIARRYIDFLEAEIRDLQEAKKPMTEDEIAEEYTSYMSEWYAFEAGVRLAEQHHGIGDKDES